MLEEMKGKRFMRKKSRIPNFKNIQEEAKVWDTHEFTEFEDELKNVEIVFDLKKPRDDVLVVRLQKSLKKRLESIAKNKGLNISTLARMWLIEKLQTSKN